MNGEYFIPSLLLFGCSGALLVWVFVTIASTVVSEWRRSHSLEKREADADRLLWDTDQDFAHSVGIKQPRGALKRRPPLLPSRHWPGPCTHGRRP